MWGVLVFWWNLGLLVLIKSVFQPLGWIGGLVDYVAGLFFFLTVIVFVLSLVYLYKEQHLKILFVTLGWLFAFVVCCFIRKRWLGFFVFFELRVIPILIIIMCWGSQPERLSAGVFLFIYMIFGSVPFLFMLVYIKTKGLTLSFFLCNYVLGDPQFYVALSLNSFNRFQFVFLVLGLLIKLPVYGLHSWLPKAHVEAPVVGSMILAGILLKLGGFGLVRLENFVFIFRLLSLAIVVWVILGRVLARFSGVRRRDLKAIVAYSSVVHMRLLFLGVCVFSIVGKVGILILRVRHGIISRGLFFLVRVIYRISSSRSILIKKGLGVSLFVLMMFWFLMCRLNMSVPPRVSVFSEILILSNLVCFSGWSVFWFLCWLLFLVGVYKVYLYILVAHTKNFFLKNCVSLKRLHKHKRFLHGFLGVWLVFYLRWFFC